MDDYVKTIVLRGSEVQEALDGKAVDFTIVPSEEAAMEDPVEKHMETYYVPSVEYAKDKRMFEKRLNELRSDVDLGRTEIDDNERRTTVLESTVSDVITEQKVIRREQIGSLSLLQQMNATIEAIRHLQALGWGLVIVAIGCFGLYKLVH